MGAGSRLVLWLCQDLSNFMFRGVRPPVPHSPLTWRGPTGHPSLGTAGGAASGGPVARQAEQSGVAVVRRAQAG